MELALGYELHAVASLLNGEHPDEHNIADFYKFAAIYAAELDDLGQAMALLNAALGRNVPEKLRGEIAALLKDIKRRSL